MKLVNEYLAKSDLLPKLPVLEAAWLLEMVNESMHDYYQISFFSKSFDEKVNAVAAIAILQYVKTCCSRRLVHSKRKISVRKYIADWLLRNRSGWDEKVMDVVTRKMKYIRRTFYDKNR